jgi:exo-beta-1,3-glucanase (GH17 family)
MQTLTLNRTVPKILIVFSSVLCFAFCFPACNGGDDDSATSGGGNGSDIAVYTLYGLNFSPYMDGQDPNLGSIVTAEQIRERLTIIAPYTEWVRTFGSAAGLEQVARIAKEMGLNTAVGAWLDSNASTNTVEMNNLIATAKNGHVDLAVVGSEVLLRGDLAEEVLIDYIEQFRAALPNIPVTTADVYTELMQHPKVMDACDVIFANYYPYWEGRDVNRAIEHLHACHRDMQARAGGKQVIVSETGWPSAGDTLGDARPSDENACYYFLNFVSWARAEGVAYLFFEAFDESFKLKYESEQGAHFGVWDKDGNLKPCMQPVFDGETVPDNWSGQGLIDGPGTPAIEFTAVPDYGSFDNLEGRVVHVQPEDYRVAVYIQAGGWWIKPYWNDPLTRIAPDGSWSCDITTGGMDHKATAIAAYLVRSGYDPPIASGGSLPPSIQTDAVARQTVTRSP